MTEQAMIMLMEWAQGKSKDVQADFATYFTDNRNGAVDVAAMTDLIRGFETKEV